MVAVGDADTLWCANTRTHARTHARTHIHFISNTQTHPHRTHTHTHTHTHTTKHTHTHTGHLGDGFPLCSDLLPPKQTLTLTLGHTHTHAHTRTRTHTQDIWVTASPCAATSPRYTSSEKAPLSFSRGRPP